MRRLLTGRFLSSFQTRLVCLSIKEEKCSEAFFKLLQAQGRWGKRTHPAQVAAVASENDEMVNNLSSPLCLVLIEIEVTDGIF